MRFSNSPPAYTSSPSGTTTRSESPMPPDEEQQRSEQRRVQLTLERMASLPREQFLAQKREERERLWYADPAVNWTGHPAIGGSHDKMVHGVVIRRWEEQGIWNKEEWGDMPNGKWKHEKLPEAESESKADLETESLPRSFSFLPRQKQPQRKAKRLKSDDDKRQFAEQEREREASRSYYQFLYQTSKVRKQVQERLEIDDSTSPADVNTMAYENVKRTWIKRWIWDGEWSILPGMSWKHERPKEETADGLGPVSANLLGHAQPLSYEAVEAPLKRIFVLPSPIEPNRIQELGIMNASQQGPSGNMESVGNGDVGRSSRPSLPRVFHPKLMRVSRPSQKKPCQKDGELASASLGPTHTSKVSKATRKQKPRPQRGLNITQTVSLGSIPLSSSSADTAEPRRSPDRETLRRSKRLRLPALSLASTESPKRVVRSKPDRNVASKSSTKPQGISKKPSAKTTRGNAKK